MHPKASESYFLHVYDVESGSWLNMTLDSPVSPLIREAMNLILRKDGILGFIGTRSEFGHYLFNLKQETGKDFRHCWISLPASTVMSMLGLYQNTENPRKPKLVFYGSPLTLALAYIMSIRQLSGMEWRVDQDFRTLARQGFLYLESNQLKDLGAIEDRMITANEYHEAQTYLEEDNREETTKNRLDESESSVLSAQPDPE
jgi:hypothetical protein